VHKKWFSRINGKHATVKQEYNLIRDSSCFLLCQVQLPSLHQFALLKIYYRLMKGKSEEGIHGSHTAAKNDATIKKLVMKDEPPSLSAKEDDFGDEIDEDKRRRR
jgi:hypothetical protein